MLNTRSQVIFQTNSPCVPKWIRHRVQQVRWHWANWIHWPEICVFNCRRIHTCLYGREYIEYTENPKNININISFICCSLLVGDTFDVRGSIKSVAAVWLNEIFATQKFAKIHTIHGIVKKTITIMMKLSIDSSFGTG